MVQKNNRPTVKDMLDMKIRGQKISMIYVTTLEEAAAANTAGIARQASGEFGWLWHAAGGNCRRHIFA